MDGVSLEDFGRIIAGSRASRVIYNMFTNNVSGIGDGGYVTTGNLGWYDRLPSSGVTSSLMGALTNGGSGYFGCVYVAGNSAHFPSNLGEIATIDRNLPSADKRAAGTIVAYDVSGVFYYARHFLRESGTGTFISFCDTMIETSEGKVGINLHGRFPSCELDVSGTISSIFGVCQGFNAETGAFYSLYVDEIASITSGLFSFVDVDFLRIDGGISTSIGRSSPSGTYTVQAITTLCSGSGLVVQLPSPLLSSGKSFTLKNIGANNVTVTSLASGKIDGLSSVTLAASGRKAIQVQSDGTAWWIIGQY